MIFHILPKEDWLKAKKSGSHNPASLEEEGFIHCSTAEELVKTADSYFRGRKDLILLRIEPQKLKAPLKYELAPERKSLFPHIYGPLNVEAVADAREFRPRPDGTFEFPPV